ncbi:MAG: MarR family transcriptional regulator [Rhizobiaceae bacterium]
MDESSSSKKSGAGQTGAADTKPDGKPAGGIVLERILPYLANRLTFRMNQLLSKDLHKHGLTISNWRVMAVLADNETASVNDLADYAMIVQPTLSRLITKMEAEGLLRRDRVESDGRVRSISLTPKGWEKFETVRALVLSHTERATRGLTDRQKLEFERTIVAMRKNLQTQRLR